MKLMEMRGAPLALFFVLCSSLAQWRYPWIGNDGMNLVHLGNPSFCGCRTRRKSGKQKAESGNEPFVQKISKISGISGQFPPSTPTSAPLGPISRVGPSLRFLAFLL